ncbi:MAG: GTP cyclohydrolase II [Deltaproteobacteria bacterium]|nr:GTP cyclohydrolase II [Deltaproteobacteria bacterium]
MFSYVDPSIYELLLDQGKIVTIGEDGRPSEDDIRPSTDRIHLLGPIPLPTMVDGREHTFRWYPFVRRTQHEQVLEIARRLRGTPDMNGLRDLLTSQMTVSSFLVYGAFEEAEVPLVRVHSCCMTGEIFGSLRCECGPQLEEAFRRIVDEGSGAIVYMASHEGRGIGLWAKGITYLLQDMGRDTYDANRDLNLPVDSRDFRDAAIVLLHFLHPPPRIRLLSNNPLKREDLTNHGIEIVGLERLVVGLTDHNLRYMHAKHAHGHATGDLPPASREDDEPKE